MKRLSIFILCISLLVSLTACAGVHPSADSPAAASAEIQKAESLTLQPETTVPTQESFVLPAFCRTGNIQQTVLYDENNVKITADNLIYGHHSAGLSLTIENNSQQVLKVLSGTLRYNCNSVNNYMYSGAYLNETVEPGKKAAASVYFKYEYLKMMGIFEIDEIQIGFEVQDTEYNILFRTGPISMKTSLYDAEKPAEYSYASTFPSQAAMQAYGYSVSFFTEECLYDSCGIRLLAGALAQREEKPFMQLELENANDAPVYVALFNLSVNGLQVQSGGYSADLINPHMRVITLTSINDLLEKEYAPILGIEEITSVSFEILALDEEENILSNPQSVTLSLPDSQPDLDLTGPEIANDFGIKIISKGLVRDPMQYSDDLHLLLLAQNQTGDYLSVDDVYDSLSVNGFMTTFFFTSQEIAPGQYALLDVELTGFSLEENGLTMDNITEVELKIEVSRDSIDLGILPLKVTIEK